MKLFLQINFNTAMMTISLVFGLFFLIFLENVIL